MNSRNKLVVPGVENLMNKYKEEIASEFGVTLNGHTSSYENGSVGGELTKRLVQKAQSELGE